MTTTDDLERARSGLRRSLLDGVRLAAAPLARTLDCPECPGWAVQATDLERRLDLLREHLVRDHDDHPPGRPYGAHDACHGCGLTDSLKPGERLCYWCGELRTVRLRKPPPNPGRAVRS